MYMCVYIYIYILYTYIYTCIHIYIAYDHISYTVLDANEAGAGVPEEPPQAEPAHVGGDLRCG